MDIKYEWADLPCSIPACVTEKVESDGDYYTILLNVNCSEERLEKAVRHELEHINNDDFHSCLSADNLELLRHK